MNQETEINWTYTMFTRKKARKDCHELGVRRWQTEPRKAIEDMVSNTHKGPWSDET